MTTRLLYPSGARRAPASAQEVTLDLLWIRDGVVAFAGTWGASPLYRAVLALGGPAHTPRRLAAADPGALGGYRAALGRLDHPFQVVVRTTPADASTAAERWEARASILPEPLAALAREHGAWVRRELPALGLLVHRAYAVVPAEEPPARRSLLAALPGRLRRHPSAALTLDTARVALAERCGRLVAALGGAGVYAARLDDLALARLYRACWNPAAAGADRLDRDLVATFGKTP